MLSGKIGHLALPHREKAHNYKTLRTYFIERKVPYSNTFLLFSKLISEVKKSLSKLQISSCHPLYV
jgi:hypothetical protein